MTRLDYAGAGERARAHRRARRPRRPRYVVLAAVGLLMLYPLVWLVGATFKSNAEIFTQVGFWPSRWTSAPTSRGWKTAPSTPSPPTSSTPS